jgi:hypothetical protein
VTCSVGTGVLSLGGKAAWWDVDLTTHLHLMSRLRMSRGVPVHPLYTCMAWTEKTSSCYVLQQMLTQKINEVKNVILST